MCSYIYRGLSLSTYVMVNIPNMYLKDYKIYGIHVTTGLLVVFQHLGTVYPSRASGFTPEFSVWFCIAHLVLVFCVVLCFCLFVSFVFVLCPKTL